MPAPQLGMWLFLASEAMFFIGLLGSFIVLESAGSQHQLFVNSSHMLDRGSGGLAVSMLLASSVAMRRPARIFRWMAVTSAIFFLLLQCAQWRQLLHHHTAIVWNSDKLKLVDGSPAKGPLWSPAHQMDAPDKVDLHAITASDFPKDPFDELGVYVIEKPDQDLNYGPSRNNFFAMYFLMTTAHVLHLLAGIIAVIWFMVFAKGRLPDAVQIYWHFVNAVGVISFLVLYFV